MANLDKTQIFKAAFWLSLLKFFSQQGFLKKSQIIIKIMKF